jgi:hypothetical protein
MKNKPDPALLGTSYLSKKIKKRTPKSRETIPLKGLSHKNRRASNGFIGYSFL